MVCVNVSMQMQYASILHTPSFPLFLPVCPLHVATSHVRIPSLSLSLCPICPPPCLPHCSLLSPTCCIPIPSYQHSLEQGAKYLHDCISLQLTATQVFGLVCGTAPQGNECCLLPQGKECCLLPQGKECCLRTGPCEEFNLELLEKLWRNGDDSEATRRCARSSRGERGKGTGQGCAVSTW
jgi:hypothetical protein